MDQFSKFFIIFTKLNLFIHYVNSDTFTVKVGTETHVNLVDTRFLSFTIDPEYLFSSNEKYNNKECICMAAALTPAFIRIAGPSTSHMTFENTSITIQPDLDSERPQTDTAKWNLEDHFKLGDLLFPNRAQGLQRHASLKKRESEIKSGHSLSVSHKQWKKFVKWANDTGFDIVFALNNQEKMDSGIWDPNSALSIISVAEKVNIGDIVWQLGYECSNQTIEEYLYDLETLRVMVETFPKGKSRRWQVVGGDISPCLQTDSKSDFKDFVSLSNDRLDAILLDGNSSTHELEKMSKLDRLKLLRLLSHSATPLWISEHHTASLPSTRELLRAAEWMTSLGHSARNGFAVHFRELREDELFQPSLSFYMALLFKNLVGERVLNAEFDTPSERTSLFAHCTSLRHNPVPGAVTLFGANMEEEPARFSLKMSKREEGGDIMQYILGLDNNGNVIVNGRAMYYEGDIRPFVKRVRPYKTLLINLPPKSFGFWVLANTKIDACYDIKSSKDNQLVKAISVAETKIEGTNLVRTKRKLESVNSPDLGDISNMKFDLRNRAVKDLVPEDLQERFDNLNKDLNSVHKLLGRRAKRTERVADNGLEEKSRNKRQTREIFQRKGDQNESLKKTPKRPIFKSKDKKIFKTSKNAEPKPKVGLLGRLYRLNTKLNETRYLINERTKSLRLGKAPKNKDSKRNSVKYPKLKKESKILNKTHEVVKIGNLQPKSKEEINVEKVDVPIKLSRSRRSILSDQHKMIVKENTKENEIDVDDDKYRKFGIMLHKINDKLNNLPTKLRSLNDQDKTEENKSEAMEDQLILKTKITDDDAFIKLSEKSSHGFLRSTFNSAVSVLEEFNTKLNSVMTLLKL